MLYIPKHGPTRLEDSQVSDCTAEFGTSVAAGGSAHVKNTTYTTLIATTSYISYGITVAVYNTAVASTRTNVLVDIAIGAAASERVIIPNLIAGNSSTAGAVQGTGNGWFFPIVIPAGVRVSATAQAFTASDTVNVHVYLHQGGVPGKWYGQRVTAYGADTANSTGTSMSPGLNVYATDVSVSASTAAPIKYLQLATDLHTTAAGSNTKGLIRLTAGSDVIAIDLPYLESTTVESVIFNQANLILSHMLFDLPVATNLKVSAMRNTGAAARGWMLYGVD